MLATVLKNKLVNLVCKLPPTGKGNRNRKKISQDPSYLVRRYFWLKNVFFQVN